MTSATREITPDIDGIITIRNDGPFGSVEFRIRSFPNGSAAAGHYEFTVKTVNFELRLFHNLGPFDACSVIERVEEEDIGFSSSPVYSSLAPKKTRIFEIDSYGEKNHAEILRQTEIIKRASGPGGIPMEIPRREPPKSKGLPVPPRVKKKLATLPACPDCPAFLPAGDTKQADLFGIVTGIEMCGRKGLALGSAQYNDSASATSNGTVLEKVNDDHLEFLEQQYASCPSAGKKWDGKLVEDSGSFVFSGIHREPELNILDINDPSSMKPKADSCSGCVNYAKPEDMFDSFGIPLALCVAKGTLLRAGHANVECVGCDWNIAGETYKRNWLHDLNHQFKPYGVVFVGDTSEQPVRVGKDGLAQNPEEVETDREVTPEEHDKGIGAWVKLRDDVFMPVFRRDFFSEDEQKKIPRSGDDEHPELYQDHLGLLEKFVIVWTKLHETPAVNGLAGSGKTEAFRYAAWRMQLPFERTSITASTELDDLAGRMLFENGETVFHPGRIPESWSKPCILLIDEPNTGSNAVWQFIRPLTDNSKQLVLDMNKGERIDRNEFCYMGMAFNPSWDHLNVGTHEISDADGRRLVHISVPNPEADVERRIIVQRCETDDYKITEGVLDQIMGISEDLRLQAKNQTIPIQWGTAQSIKTARLSRWFSLKDSVKMAIADLLEPEQRELVMQTIKGRIKE